jgi:hypothetical protein
VPPGQKAFFGREPLEATFFWARGTARSVHGNRSKCEVRRSGPSTRTRQRSLAMVKAKPKAYEDYTPPGGTERRLRLAPGTASGYYGVIKNKGKWQGMGYDPNKQSRRALPGLYAKPQDAAVQVAMFDATFKDGAWDIPSPKKYAERGSGVPCLPRSAHAAAVDRLL